MADKRCENGHFIDESWDLCPYCPAENSEQEIPVVRPARVISPEAARPAAVAPPTPVVPRRDAPPSTAPPMDRTVAVRAIDPNAPLKRYVVGWLVGLSGPTRGESYPVRMGRNVLGRDKRSDIIVTDEQASSHHADLIFRPEERRFILMDHNSTNGTYVNEAEIEPRRDLGNNDVIRIGAQKFLFVPLVRDDFFWDDEGALK